MKQKKILIVEDELIIAENLRFILNEYGYKFVDVAIDDIEAQQLFKKIHYDLVLMDVNLGENSALDGIDLIKLLQTKYSFVFIYVTANADKNTLEKAKNTNPSGYVVKPFVNNAIYANVEMALFSIKEAFFLHVYKGMQQQVPISKITHATSEGAYIYLSIVDQDKLLVRKSLIEFKELHPNFFIRIHNSILVNRNYINGHTSQIVKVNSVQLPLGRAYKKVFLEEIKKLSFS
jgi:DNA-binding LytR/AlgR family response regulator